MHSVPRSGIPESVQLQFYLMYNYYQRGCPVPAQPGCTPISSVQIHIPTSTWHCQTSNFCQLISHKTLICISLLMIRLSIFSYLLTIVSSFSKCLFVSCAHIYVFVYSAYESFGCKYLFSFGGFPCRFITMFGLTEFFIFYCG